MFSPRSCSAGTSTSSRECYDVPGREDFPTRQLPSARWPCHRAWLRRPCWALLRVGASRAGSFVQPRVGSATTGPRGRAGRGSVLGLGGRPRERLRRRCPQGRGAAVLHERGGRGHAAPGLGLHGECRGGASGRPAAFGLGNSGAGRVKLAARVDSLVSATRLRRREEAGSRTSRASEVGSWPWCPVRGDFREGLSFLVCYCHCKTRNQQQGRCAGNRSRCVSRPPSPPPDVSARVGRDAIGLWEHVGTRPHRPLLLDTVQLGHPVLSSHCGQAPLTHRHNVCLPRVSPWAASTRGKAGDWRGASH